MNQQPVSMFAVLGCGMLFGFGLALATMISPEIVLGFLRFQDWGLMLVLGGAVCVTFVAYRFAPRWLQRPLLGPAFHGHPSEMSRDTLLGAAIFGIGWGLCGVCPGPAIASLGAGNWPGLWALAGIAAGAWLHGAWADRRTIGGPAAA
jgi:uncharacterized protein